ncbi:MAG: hypothetical protein ACP5FR_03525 [Candidatus Micrarchaeia archaeon]
MKALVISDDIRYGIMLSNVLNESGINTKQSDRTFNDIASVSDIIENSMGDCDIVFIASKKPIETGITLNKGSSVKGAVCKSRSDAKEAIAAGANAIIIGTGNIDSKALGEIAEEVAASESILKQSYKALLSSIKSSAEQQKAKQVHLQDAPQKEKKQKQKSRDDYDKSEEDAKGNDGSGGIIGSIKSALGFQ